MAVDGIVYSPSFLLIKNTGGQEEYLNSSLVVGISKSKDKNFSNGTDVLMLNGDVHTTKESLGQVVERYSRDARNGCVRINLMG